jgi:hypothetical protein
MNTIKIIDADGHIHEDVKGFVEREDLPAELNRKILWDKPKRLYGI